MIDALLFAAGLAFFMAIEAWQGNHPKAPLPLWLAPFMLAALFALLFGGTLTLSPLIAHVVGQIATLAGAGSDQIVSVISAVTGVWIASIILQLARNAVRIAQRRDAQDLRWIDNPFRREE